MVRCGVGSAAGGVVVVVEEKKLPTVVNTFCGPITSNATTAATAATPWTIAFASELFSDSPVTTFVLFTISVGSGSSTEVL